MEVWKNKSENAGGIQVYSTWFVFNAISFILSRVTSDVEMDWKDIQHIATQVTHIGDRCSKTFMYSLRSSINALHTSITIWEMDE